MEIARNRARDPRSRAGELDGNGRVVVRYSGTEALARVMIEAESEAKMKSIASGISEKIRERLGAG